MRPELLSHNFTLPDLVIRICWGTFAVVWLFAAISTKRTIYRENTGSRLRYRLPVILALFLLARGPRMIYPLNIRIVPRTDSLEWACAVLCVAGLVFCCWARATIGRNWSGIVTLKEDHELIIHGPYALVRHPIYTGLLVMFAATALFSGYAAGILGSVIVFVGFWIKLSEEEKLMLNKFPEQYPGYQQRVKRIIPFLF